VLLLYLYIYTAIFSFQYCVFVFGSFALGCFFVLQDEFAGYWWYHRSRHSRFRWGIPIQVWWRKWNQCFSWILSKSDCARQRCVTRCSVITNWIMPACWSNASFCRRHGHQYQRCRHQHRCKQHWNTRYVHMCSLLTNCKWWHHSEVISFFLQTPASM